MRRVLAASLAFFALLGVVLALPVYASPAPDPEPVETAIEEVAMGSVDAPAAGAAVEEGTSDPVNGVPDDAPTLTVHTGEVGTFSLVGVTWAADAAVTDTIVQIRARDKQGQWTGWTEVTVEDANQDPGVAEDADLRGGTAPLWTGPSTAVEAELVTRSGAQPEDVRLDLVDPGESLADSTPGAPAIQDTAQAATAMPDVYSRSQWGADESIRTWAPQYAPTIRAATVHHTADTNNYTADQVPAMMRSIYRYHTVSRGWGDIGYNVIVDRFGRRWEGRYGGLASTVVGAHAGGFNSGTFGVSMLGNYDTAPVPQVVVESVASIIAWKFSLYGVDPRGSVTLTSGGGGTSRYAAGVPVTLPTVFGHRDVGSTTCPGQYGYGRMGEIRQRVAALTVATASPIESRYQGDVGLRQALGTAVGDEQSRSGVSWQVFQRGRLYYSPQAGVHLLRNGNLDAYLAAGGPAALGAPTTDETGTADGRGVYNHFADASVFWSPTTGSRIVHGAVRGRWAETGWEAGPLGYPTTDTVGVGATGAMNGFQGGAVYWSAATGAQVVTGGLRGEWERRGGAAGHLGFPSSSEVSAGGGGFGQSFQGGGLFWSAPTGAWVVTGAIRAAWDRTGTGGGALGYPTDDEAPLPGGRAISQTFTGGQVVWTSSTGAHPLSGPLLAAWRTDGAGSGGTGYPTSDPALVAGVQLQSFEGAVLVASSGGVLTVAGEIRLLWEASGGAAGALGPPVTDEVVEADRTVIRQSFRGGTVWWSRDGGAHATSGAIGAHHGAVGGADGRLGVPVANMVATVGGGFAQVFRGGRVLWSPLSGAHYVTGGIGSWWTALGAEQSGLGYPTTDERGLSDGRGIVQSFTGGAVYWTAATGSRAVSGAILSRWRANQSERGPLGYPVEDMVARAGGGFSQRFEGGTLVWGPATGVHVVTNGIRAHWEAGGAERGGLGMPLGDESASVAGTGVIQVFTGGRVYWSPVGTWSVSGAILAHYLASGADGGPLGLPRSSMRAAPGGVFEQAFAGGMVRWSALRGAWT